MPDERKPNGGDGDPNCNECYAQRAFKSTPYFIESLTDLGVKILTE